MDHSKEFFEFLLRKDFCWDSIFEEMSDRLMEDEFNSPIAEKALDIAFELYPDGSDKENELMEKDMNLFQISWSIVDVNISSNVQRILEWLQSIKLKRMQMLKLNSQLKSIKID